jgi:hypothetical protein
MKKIIISFIISLWIIWVSFANTLSTSVSWNNNIVECWNITSHSVTHYGVPISPNLLNASPIWVNYQCIAHAYYTSDDYFMPNSGYYTKGSISYCGDWHRVVQILYYNSLGTQVWSQNIWGAQFAWVFTQYRIKCSKFDDVAPTLANVTSNNSGNLLANHNKNYSIGIDNWWFAPITSVDAQKENFNDDSMSATFPMSCTTVWSTSTCNTIWNISKVDGLYRNVDWNTARQYKFSLTKITDEAWNYWIWTKDFLHNVYADSPTLIWNVTTNTLDDGNIADWTEENLTITLKDTYWNIIIPTPTPSPSWIWRTVNLAFNTQNDVYLNQYAKTWNWVYLTTPRFPSPYTNAILTWSTTTNFPLQPSSDWTYPFKFKIYTPTHDPYIKSNSSLYFNNMIWSVSNTYDASWNRSINIIDSDFNLRVNPLYYTTISWDIINDWFIEWAQQENNIQMSKNLFMPTSNELLYLEFGSWNTNDVNTSLNLKAWSISWSLNIIWEWNPNFSLFKNFSTWNYPVFTNLLLQGWWTLNDIQSSYFSTHIWYDITGPNWWTINPIYNSDIYWKDSYWGTIWTGWTYASAVKIIWQTYSKKYSEILTWQSWTDVKLLNWSITKSSLKTAVRKNAYNIIKNIFATSSWNTINDNDFMSNTDWIKLLSWSMIYFNWLDWDNVSINIPLTFVWNKTILIEWWNLYINNDINVSWSKSMLSIVVLKDSNWKGWNIYINPDVKSIKATMYADKSLISYDGTNELDWNTSFSVLKNQLYIYGSVFSENTIGWSRTTPIKCPYYVTSINCDTIEKAQKYDLNYLRRYYLKDTDSDWIGNTPAWWGSSVFSYPLPNSKYPLVIQYNPLIQTDPSILFMK